jgi:hypothetical protein
MYSFRSATLLALTNYAIAMDYAIPGGTALAPLNCAGAAQVWPGDTCAAFCARNNVPQASLIQFNPPLRLGPGETCESKLRANDWLCVATKDNKPPVYPWDKQPPPPPPPPSRPVTPPPVHLTPPPPPPPTQQPTPTPAPAFPSCPGVVKDPCWNADFMRATRPAVIPDDTRRIAIVDHFCSAYLLGQPFTTSPAAVTLCRGPAATSSACLCYHSARQAQVGA